MVRHMLLIGGARGIHPKAKKLGLRLSLLMRMPRLLAQKDLNTYDRIVGMPVNATDEEWVAQARLIHQVDPIDAIGGFNEVSQNQAAAIAESLGLPFYTQDVIDATQQKDKMRQRLYEAGLDATPVRQVSSVDEIAAFGAAHGYPLVLKPVDARGSLGVSIVRSSQDIGAAFAWFQQWASQYRMLAEQFLEGEEYSVEAFSERGQHRVVCVTQKFKDAMTSVETGHCLPAPLAEDTRTAIEQYVVRVLSALGIQNGPSHTEVIVTAAGPRIVETHLRLGGDSIVDLIQLAGGVDLDELWVRQTMGEAVLAQLPDRMDQFAAISFVTPQAVGTLERVEGVAEAAALPGVARVELMQPQGAQVRGAYDSFSRGAYAIAVADTADEAVARAQAATRRLRFMVLCTG